MWRMSIFTAYPITMTSMHGKMRITPRIFGSRKTWMNSLISISRTRSNMLRQLLLELPPGREDHHCGECRQQQPVRRQDLQSHPLEVDSLENRDEIPRRHQVGDPLDRPRHVDYREDKTG